MASILPRRRLARMNNLSILSNMFPTPAFFDHHYRATTVQAPDAAGSQLSGKDLQTFKTGRAKPSVP
jgi:hypothetical protein